MADVTIADKEITFDFEKITITEYRDFCKGSLADEGDDELLARVIGQPVEWVRSLSQPNFRRILQAFFKKGREPLNDPN